MMYEFALIFERVNQLKLFTEHATIIYNRCLNNIKTPPIYIIAKSHNSFDYGFFLFECLALKIFPADNCRNLLSIGN